MDNSVELSTNVAKKRGFRRHQSPLWQQESAAIVWICHHTNCLAKFLPGSNHFSQSVKIPAMPFSHTFEHDQQFMRLVRRETDVDLITAALEIARDGQANFDFAPTRLRLQRSIARLTHPVTQAGSDLEELKMLVRHMTEELNLHGDDDCHGDPEASYLNRVLETGRGIPISLSLIYLNVANELGIPLEPIAAPHHFLTRLPTDSGNLYVDAFNGGRIMDEPECIAWLRDVTELPMPEIRRTLKPVDERTIMVRMLNNLKTLFGNRELWVSAWRVQSRIALLIPGSYRERRDLAILTLRSGRPGESKELLRACLAVAPAEEHSMLKQYIVQADKMLPLCN